MKVRNDFVTNSSSSSFILAKSGELNERQKEEILKFVEKEFLGTKILSSESTEDEIQKVFKEEYEFEDKDMQNKVRGLLKEGKSICQGWVTYEECEYSYAGLFERIWNILEKYGEGNFVAISDDLSY